MHKKNFLLVIVISTLITQPIHCSFWSKLGKKIVGSVESAAHSLATVATGSQLSPVEEAQANEVIRIINVHAFITHILKKQQVWSRDTANNAPYIAALIPAFLVTASIWKNLHTTDTLVAGMMGTTLGIATWFASSQWMKTQPKKAANFFPNVFVLRFALWLYEKFHSLTLPGTISLRAMQTAHHVVNSDILCIKIPKYNIWLQRVGDEEISFPKRSKKFTGQLTTIIRSAHQQHQSPC